MKLIKTYENFNLFYDNAITNEYTHDYADNRYEVQKIIDKLKSGKEISSKSIKFLDEISGYKNFYETTKKWLNNIFDIFKKYSYDDVDDRLLEFFEEIPKFKCMVMFSISNENRSAIGISSKRISDPKYLIEEIGHIINDMSYRCSSKYDRMTIDEYYDTMRPAIYIGLNRFAASGNKNMYNLLFLEKLADKIVKRFKYLYKIGDVFYDYHREDRQYNPNMDVPDYSLVLYLL